MRRLSAWLAAAVLAIPAVALAGREKPLEKPFDVQLQGGVGGWTGKASDVTSNVGPAYGVLGAYNWKPWLSFELGYAGHSNGIDNSNSRLASNKVQGDAKAGPTFLAPVPWRPYAFAGVAGDFVSAGISPAGFTDSFQGLIPLGAGADFFLESPFRVGARGTFDLNPGVGGNLGPVSKHPNGWQAVVTASATF